MAFSTAYCLAFAFFIIVCCVQKTRGTPWGLWVTTSVSSILDSLFPSQVMITHQSLSDIAKASFALSSLSCCHDNLCIIFTCLSSLIWSEKTFSNFSLPFLAVRNCQGLPRVKNGLWNITRLICITWSTINHSFLIYLHNAVIKIVESWDKL